MQVRCCSRGARRDNKPRREPVHDAIPVWSAGKPSRLSQSTAVYLHASAACRNGDHVINHPIAPKGSWGLQRVLGGFSNISTELALESSRELWRFTGIREEVGRASTGFGETQS
eukprot:9201997-Alexandrium_andersonii.AAC.1